MQFTETEISETNNLLTYFASERISPQWSAFLLLLGDELTGQLTSEELRHLLTRLGSRFAETHPLGICSNVAALEDALNRLWEGMRWGHVSLSDQDQFLTVSHQACPLPMAMHLDPQVAGGYLEGAYSVWLRAAGAPTELVLKQKSVDDRRMTLVFELTAA